MVANVLVLGRAFDERPVSDAMRVSGVSTCTIDEYERLLLTHKPDVVAIDAHGLVQSGADLDATLQALQRCHSKRDFDHKNFVCLLCTDELDGKLITIADATQVASIAKAPFNEVNLEQFVKRELQSIWEATPRKYSLGLPGDVVFHSVAMREVWRIVLLAAQADSSTILVGETGSGKEILARALHRFSSRRNGPFIAMNCAAIPETLLESELFGHEKGAFTGALQQHKGRFELADGGTLLLDEIGDLTPALQVKLLRVLQERCFERLGGRETVSVDVRIVAATHKNLVDEVNAGRFRADLYYRLSVLPIHVPPLRTRKDDILPLWESFLQRIATRTHRSVPSVGVGVSQLLLCHDWPGNVRELENAAEHALLLSSGQITECCLPATLTASKSTLSPAEPWIGRTFKDIERAAILANYHVYGTVAKAASSLQISERRIQYRLKEYKQDAEATANLASNSGLPSR